MDFHTLSRRDLQALCKRNKIPANMTNVAMADALQALGTVEGLEEVLAHPEADSLNTPARSMAATPSVYRTATSKLTRTRQTTKKEMPETAPPSAVQHAYSTRRSTRLLEKQMCQLSLKETEDMVDAKAVMEKDSHDMQRQFSQDMDNSLADKTFSDESNITKEATEKPTEGTLPTEPSMMLNNNVGYLETPITEVEESNNDKDCKVVSEDQPMSEDVVMQEDVNAVFPAQDAVSKPVEDEVVLGSESKVTEDASTPVCQPMQDLATVTADEVILEGKFKLTENAATVTADETQKGIDTTGPNDISCETVMEDDEAEQKMASSEDDEFGFLSESSEEDSDSDDSEEVEEAVIDYAPEPLLDGDKSAIRSSSKKSASAQKVVHHSDNDEKFEEIASRLQQDENVVSGAAATANKTPIDKKSLRQLKRMVREKKQQKAEEKKRPLQVHTENV